MADSCYRIITMRDEMLFIRIGRTLSYKLLTLFVIPFVAYYNETKSKNVSFKNQALLQVINILRTNHPHTPFLASQDRTSRMLSPIVKFAIATHIEPDGTGTLLRPEFNTESGKYSGAPCCDVRQLHTHTQRPHTLT